MLKNEFYEILFETKSQKKIDVSVCISLYNYENKIIETLNAVKLQTYQKPDVIIVDDCSTDHSADLVTNWLETNHHYFNNTILCKHKKNSKLSATRNTAISLSTTKYIFILDADNIIYPSCIRKLRKAMINANASFAYSIIERFGAESSLMGLKPWNPFKLKNGNTIDAMVLHKRDILNQAGNYDENMIFGWEDYELWFRIADINGWGVQVPEILAKYRVNESSMLNTTTFKNEKKIWEYIKQKHKKYFSD